LIVNSVLNSLLLKVSNTGVILEEEPIPELHLINFTDWGWVVFFIVVTLVTWGLIMFQSNSKGAHQYGVISDSENNHESEAH
jgi:hypothetical protein